VRIGPRTGAGDGQREYNAQTNVRRGQTGSHWKAEEKKAKQDAAKAERQAKRAAKQAEKKGWLS
jgi:hypothetical protein